MGLPQIQIEFKTKADTLVKRSERGIVALILKDNTGAFDTKIYNKESEIDQADWTALNRDYLAKTFLGQPSKVIVERIPNDGEIVSAFERLNSKVFNYLAVPKAGSDANAVVTWIKDQRDNKKRSCKAVLSNVSAEYEGIINFATENIKVGAKTYTAEEYTVRIAGLLAGLPLNQSATYYVLSEVESITENPTPDTEIDEGKLILINDGSKIKIGRGVNSLTTTTEAKGEDFKKIKIVEAIDLIRDDIRTTFEDNYVGKVANSYDNKILFIAAVNRYFKELQGSGILYDKYDHKADIDVPAQTEWLKQNQNIEGWDETKIKQANTGSNVFVTAQLKLQDAIEDLRFSIFV